MSINKNKNGLIESMSNWPNVWDANFSLLDEFFFAPDIFRNTWLPQRDTLNAKARLGFNVPAMNVEEQENKYIFSLAVPGMKKEDFTIEVKNGGLSITGKHTHTETTKQRKYKRQEYNYNAFTRFFPLPKDADNMEVEAQYQNGVLVLTVAKKVAKPESGRKIAIH